jgi:hypothetical protein
LKYVTRGRGKYRVMTGLEFMARLAAIICPPRYPLVRFAGVFGPRSAWRKDIVPKPRLRPPACDGAGADVTGEDVEEAVRPRAKPKKEEGSSVPRAERPGVSAGAAQQAWGVAATIMPAPDVVGRPGDVIALTPNVSGGTGALWKWSPWFAVPS